MLPKTIRFKISIVILLLLFITIFSFSALTLKATDGYILDDVMKRAEAVGVGAAAWAAYGMISEDMLALDNVVTRVMETHQDVESIAIVDSWMEVLAHSEMEKRGSRLEVPEGELVRMGQKGAFISRQAGFEVLTPVFFSGTLPGGGKHLGYVVLGVKKSLLFNAQKAARGGILKGFIIACLLGVFGIVTLSSFLTRPIKELSAGVVGLREGKSRQLKVYSKDELGMLTESFNEMSDMILYQKDRLGSYARELEEAYLSTLRVLAAAIDARDPYTMGHSTRVASMSVKLGEKAGLGGLELEDIEIACLLHDVGKLKTPDYILLKEGPLSVAELEQMRRHPEHGAEILGRAQSLARFIPAVMHHHEWHNGRGYPGGLSGEEIPIEAAIISIADSFDAMTSIRPYRKPGKVRDALRELKRCSGTQFNPELVMLFTEMVGVGDASAGVPGGEAVA